MQSNAPTRLLLLLALLLCSVRAARAHDTGLDVIRVIVTARGAFVSTSVHRSGRDVAAVDRDIRARMLLMRDGVRATIGTAHTSVETARDLVYWQAPVTSVTRFASGSFALAGPFSPENRSMKTALIVFQNGAVVSQSLYEPAPIAGAAAHTAPSPAASRSGSVLLLYGRLGIEHLATGLDHVLFVVALVLAGGKLRTIAKIVTCFTIAHSITLGGAALGLFSLSPRFVEPVIALSIIAVAIEAARHRPEARDRRPYLAFGFGLIHGFGFAGGIIEKGFPRQAIVPALFGFNLGLEIAQIITALATLTLLGMVSGLPPKRVRGIRLGAAGVIAAIALGMFVQRISA